jgi:hypothetical protein
VRTTRPAHTKWLLNDAETDAKLDDQADGETAESDVQIG